MPDRSWKAWERRVAKLFGGQRRGADYKAKEGGGKNDIILEGWSIECKLYARPSFGVMMEAVRQAEANVDDPYDIPIGVIKKKGRGIPDKDALVIMRLETFLEFFGPGETEPHPGDS